MDFYSHSIRIAQTDLSFTDVNCTNPPHVLPIWINKHEHTRSNRIETDGRTYWNKTKKRTQFNVKSRMSFPINVTVHTLYVCRTRPQEMDYLFLFQLKTINFVSVQLSFISFYFVVSFYCCVQFARTVFLDNNFVFSLFFAVFIVVVVNNIKNTSKKPINDDKFCCFS